MRLHLTKYTRILAIDPCVRGLGFVVLEGDNRLIDWGVARLYSKNDAELLVRVDALLRKFVPNVIALEDTSGMKRRKSAAMRINALATFGRVSGINLAVVANRISLPLLGLPQGATKRDAAKVIAHMFPELEGILPTPRQLWQTEHLTMNVFDAARIALSARVHLAGNREASSHIND